MKRAQGKIGEPFWRLIFRKIGFTPLKSNFDPDKFNYSWVTFQVKTNVNCK